MIISVLDSYHEQLRRLCETHGVRRLELFGSALRREMTDASDFDFAVDFGDQPAAGSFKRYMHLKFDYAVERCFEIAGEALSQLNKIDPTTAQQIEESFSSLDPRPSPAHNPVIAAGVGGIGAGLPSWSFVSDIHLVFPN